MSEAAVFDELVSEFYRVWFRYHPTAAIYAGVGGYEGLLAADGDDDRGALASWLGNLLLGLEELDYEALDADRQLDLNLLFGAVMIEHRILLEQDWRHRDPAKYLPLRAIQELVVRQPERLCEALQGMLERTPNYLRDARGQLAECPELVSTLWLADALETSEAGVPWLKRLGWDLPQTHECCADQGRLQTLGSQAAEAIEDYHDFLVRELAPAASGTAESGTELVNQLLRHRHQLELDAERALAKACLLRDEMRQQVEQKGAPEELAQLSGEARLQAYRDELCRLKGFVAEQGMLQLPEQPLETQLTDSCFTPCECGTYLRSNRGGVFLIPDDTQIAGGESLASIRLRVLYSGWAGRHFLCWSGGVAARSLVRQINPSPAFKRGWAHYMSRLLEARGYFDETDRGQLNRRRLALAEQAVVDLEFHTGRINSQQALERLRGLSALPGWAEGRLTALSRRPTDAAMALFGISLIESARDIAMSEQSGLDLQGFHSRLLTHGAVALPLVVKRVFGEPLWRQAADRVFVSS
jgi:hypothetical protein